MGPMFWSWASEGHPMGFVLLLSILMVKVADAFVFVPLACHSEG